MHELRVDPEFRDKIPPLTDAEFEQLRENILSDGEVYEPIVVWNGTIIDGHNRWRIIQEHPEITYKVKEMDFENKWVAFAWMYKKQLGRRNLTDEQQKYIMGKRNEAEKMAVGAPSKKDQSGPLREKGKTAQKIADEYGVGYGTVLRAEQFAKGVDKVREVSPEAAEKILKGKSLVSQKEIQELAKKNEEEVRAAAKHIENDEPIPTIKQKRNPTEIRKAATERETAIETAIERITNSDKAEYTYKDLIDEVITNAAPFVSMLRNMIAIRSSVLSENGARAALRLTIETEIINKIQDIKELI